MTKSKKNGAVRRIEIMLTDEEREKIVAVEQNTLRAKVDLADADCMVAEAETRREHARRAVAVAMQAFNEGIKASVEANHIDPRERWDLNLREGVWRKQ